MTNELNSCNAMCCKDNLNLQYMTADNSKAPGLQQLRADEWVSRRDSEGSRPQVMNVLVLIVGVMRISPTTKTRSTRPRMRQGLLRR